MHAIIAIGYMEKAEYLQKNYNELINPLPKNVFLMYTSPQER